MKIKRLNEAYWESKLNPEKRRELAKELIIYLKDKFKDEENTDNIGAYFMAFCGSKGLTFTESRDLDKEITDMNVEKDMLGDLAGYIKKRIEDLSSKYGNGDDDIYDRPRFTKELNKELDWISTIYNSPEEIKNIELVRDRFNDYY